MKPPIPLHDPRFVYIPAKDHDADSQPFRARQQARIRAAQAVREEARAKTVSLPRKRPVREESA